MMVLLSLFSQNRRREVYSLAGRSITRKIGISRLFKSNIVALQLRCICMASETET
jgi:hypothetical protein